MGIILDLSPLRLDVILVLSRHMRVDLRLMIGVKWAQRMERGLRVVSGGAVGREVSASYHHHIFVLGLRYDL